LLSLITSDRVCVLRTNRRLQANFVSAVRKQSFTKLQAISLRSTTCAKKVVRLPGLRREKQTGDTEGAFARLSKHLSCFQYSK
jgi:hypothetical protein